MHPTQYLDEGLFELVVERFKALVFLRDDLLGPPELIQRPANPPHRGLKDKQRLQEEEHQGHPVNQVIQLLGGGHPILSIGFQLEYVRVHDRQEVSLLLPDLSTQARIERLTWVSLGESHQLRDRLDESPRMR